MGDPHVSVDFNPIAGVALDDQVAEVVLVAGGSTLGDGSCGAETTPPGFVGRPLIASDTQAIKIISAIPSGGRLQANQSGLSMAAIRTCAESDIRVPDEKTSKP